VAAKLIKEVNAAECFGLDQPFHSGLARDALRFNMYSWFEGSSYDINCGTIHGAGATTMTLGANNLYDTCLIAPIPIPVSDLPGGTAMRDINIEIRAETSGAGATATVRAYLVENPPMVDVFEPDQVQEASLEMGDNAVFDSDTVADAPGVLSFTIAPNFPGPTLLWLRIIARIDDNGETLELSHPFRIWEDREPF